MSRLILPATAKYNIERDRLAERHEALKWFDHQLKGLDPHAELVKVSEQAGAPGLEPGFWHVRRTDPVTGWQAYITLRGPNGEFSEPHSGHLERLRASDLQRAGAFEDMKRRWDREDEARAKSAAWTRAELKDEFMARYLNKTRPSISFSETPGGWRNRLQNS